MKTYAFIFLLAIVFLLPFSVTGFQVEQLPHPDSPSSKVFMRMHQSLQIGQYKTANLQLDSMLVLATAERDTNNMGLALEGLVEISFLMTDFKTTKEKIATAIKTLEKSTEYRRLCLFYTRLGSVYIDEKKFDLAYQYLKKGKALLARINHPNAYYVSYTELGSYFKATAQPDSSIHYLLKLVDYLEPTDSIRLGNTYIYLSIQFLKLYNYDRALEFSEKALALDNPKTNRLGVAKHSLRKADVLNHQGHYKEAEDIANQAIGVFEKFRIKRWQNMNKIILAYAAIGQEDFIAATKWIGAIDTTAFKDNLEDRMNLFIFKIRLALENNDLEEIARLLESPDNTRIRRTDLPLQNQYYDLVGEYYQRIGNYKQSNQMYVARQVVQDSLHNIQRSNIAQNLEAKHQSKEQNQLIANMEVADELNQTRLSQQRWLIGLSLFITGVFAALFFKFSQQNKKIKIQNIIISKSLEEKEILLREIHHRVKNNLQVISSLLGLQSRKIKDQAALDAINEGRSRVQSMSLIHQDLYKKDNLTGINIKDYLEKLCSGLFATYNISNDRIQLKMDIEKLVLDVDSIVPVGLILNELISNALKHAFPGERTGTISINIKENAEGLLLSVSDDGIGIDPQSRLKDETNATFGYHLIKSFQRKLDADLDISGNDGTNITLLIRKYKLAA